jgi:hypothetical protein
LPQYIPSTRPGTGSTRFKNKLMMSMTFMLPGKARTEQAVQQPLDL